MPTDRQILRKINHQLGVMEEKGDANSIKWFENILAPKFAFMRSNGTFDNRKKFIKKIKPSDPRETKIISIKVFENRAMVACIVTVKSAEGEKKYHNLRLFVRYEMEWRLLGWANEEIKQPE